MWNSIEALATAHNGRQYFLGLRGGKDEFHMRGRLLQCLEQGIECRRGEHVHFVDNVDFEPRLSRRITCVLAQLAHLFDAVVARAVDLEHVEAIARRDLAAVIAHAAGSHGWPVDAIERFRQNTCGGCLARATRADEQISVREPVLQDSILERTRDVLLPDNIVERLRPIFTREHLVAHVLNLNALPALRK